MSIAGQRQKYYVRIQSIGTARNLYTVFTLETKNHFRADSDTSQWLLLHFKWIVWIRIINILSGRMVLHMMVKRFGCNSGFAVSFIYLINYWFFFVIYRRTYRCSSCHMSSRYQAYSRKVYGSIFNGLISKNCSVVMAKVTFKNHSLIVYKMVSWHVYEVLPLLQLLQLLC